MFESEGLYYKENNIDIATKQFLRFVADIFLCVDFEMLLAQYVIFREEELSPEDIRKYLTVWVAHKENISAESAEIILDNYRFEEEMGIIDKIHTNLDELESAFVFNKLDTSLDCWWSNFSRQERDIEQMENFIGNQTQGSKFRRIDAYHENFVSSAELLLSIKEVILDR